MLIWMRKFSYIDNSKIHTKGSNLRVISTFPREYKEQCIKNVWLWVSRYVLDNNYSPLVREISEGTKIPKSSVSKYLYILHRRGYIEMTENKIRGIEVLRFPLEMNNGCSVYNSTVR